MDEIQNGSSLQIGGILKDPAGYGSPDGLLL